MIGIQKVEINDDVKTPTQSIITITLVADGIDREHLIKAHAEYTLSKILSAPEPSQCEIRPNYDPKMATSINWKLNRKSREV